MCTKCARHYWVRVSICKQSICLHRSCDSMHQSIAFLCHCTIDEKLVHKYKNRQIAASVVCLHPSNGSQQKYLPSNIKREGGVDERDLKAIWMAQQIRKTVARLIILGWVSCTLWTGFSLSLVWSVILDHSRPQNIPQANGNWIGPNSIFQ